MNSNILIDLLIFIILIRISYLDIRIKTLPNSYCFTILIISAFCQSNIPYLQRIIEAIIISIPLLIIWFVYKKGMGAGDIKLVAVLTLTYGFVKILHSVLSGMIIAFIYTIIKKGKIKEIPLVPFISLGVFVSIFY